MNSNQKSRFRAWAIIAGIVLLLAVIGAITPEDKAAVDTRNASAWEKHLRAANGPNWIPTKSEEAVIRSSASVSAVTYGAPPKED